MLSTVLAVILLVPRAPADAPIAVYAERLSDVQSLRPFLQRAGEYSTLLREKQFRDFFLPLLDVNPMEAASTEAAGLDGAASASLSTSDTANYGCATIKQRPLFDAAVKRRLATLGNVRERVVHGTIVVQATDSLGRTLGGYALRGKELCMPNCRPEHCSAALTIAVDLLRRTPGSFGWKLRQQLKEKRVVLVTPTAAFGLSSSADAATFDVALHSTTFGGLLKNTSSHFAASNPDVLLYARAATDLPTTKRASAWLSKFLSGLCKVCDAAAVQSAFEMNQPSLTGHSLLVVRDIAFTRELASETGRYFAVKHALFTQVRDVDTVVTSLQSLRSYPWVQSRPDGTLDLKTGSQWIQFGAGPQEQTWAFVANDEASWSATQQSLTNQPGTQVHGLEFKMSPQRLAKALARIDLMQALSTPELAGVLAANVTYGPLLAASNEVSGHLDSAGTNTYRGTIRWTLAEDSRGSNP